MERFSLKMDKKKFSCVCTKEDHITPIVKVVDYCNFTCEFCRYSQNKAKNIMGFDTYVSIVEKACNYNTFHNCNHLSIIYHGGEPLLWGINNFKKAMMFQEEIKNKYPDFIFHNNIQTNGFLLNQEWIDFLKKNDFNIGISIDGPDEINFHKNAIGNQRVLDNIHKLNSDKCRFGILSVITNSHKGCADKYYEFLVENNIHSVGLCYCIYNEIDGRAVNNDILTDFLLRLFELYYFGNYNLRIREFEYTMKLCMGIDTNSCTNSLRSKCGNYYSILPNGDIKFCDPYSLDEKGIGNIFTDSFFDIKKSPLLHSIKQKAITTTQKTCDICSIKDICGGGCYRHVLLNNKNVFCETFKVVYPFIKQVVLSSLHKSGFKQYKFH